MDILARITEQEVTQDGQLPSGFLFASIKNVGNAVATVNGVPLRPGEAKSYPFVGKGYQAIVYQLNGSSLLVMQIV